MNFLVKNIIWNKVVLKVSSEYIVNTFEIIAFGKLITKTSISEKLKFYDPHGKRITWVLSPTFFSLIPATWNSHAIQWPIFQITSASFIKISLHYIFIIFRNVGEKTSKYFWLWHTAFKSHQKELEKELSRWNSKVIVFSLVIFKFPEIIFSW